MYNKNRGGIMNTYDLVNMYYNFIFNSGMLSYRRVYENYDNIDTLKIWLDSYDIHLSFISHIYKENYDLLLRAKSFEKYDMAFKTDYQSDYERYINEESKKYQVLFLSKDKPLSMLIDIDDYQFDNIRSFLIDDVIEEGISVYGPYPLFLNALYQIDKWPGILVFKDQKCFFSPIQTKKDIDEIFIKIKNDDIFNGCLNYENENYFIHLSDLHLGTKQTDQGVNVLYDSLDELYGCIPHQRQIKFLITGDLMNSPNRKNMYAASSFMNSLKRRYQGDVTFVLGNHDMIVHGLNIFKRQKTKVVAYLLGENIKVFHDIKMIVIKIDSTSQGNLARGKVGLRHLQEIEEELLSIKNIDDYTLIVMMHHHIVPLRKDEFLKTKWNEKLFMGKIADSTKALVDADDVLRWIDKHHIKYIFHGHKHIPCVIKNNGTYIMAGGSSCGGETKENKSRYLSYNLLKYDIKEKRFQYCFIFYDDITKQERHRVKVTLFKEDQMS